ncbi:hypothetical protein K2173_010504 [Erythroxylum novogranatense]|uniref:Late embryogenesis abundant protein LEA-2 subgroup domain-containing protein n=1 Tax=Erythroxylum novogranatense TaxID=1862640 RepID=A0AAV8TG70_9ROSI|nr:hypothetical protein K2173_010504 [Erythroxylum novogranatense]
MHAKTDSEGTSVDTSWPPRSPRRPVYYVQSPSNHDVEKMSYGSSPVGSPAHHYYHCSPIHHSRESSTSRFSASLKNPRSLTAWKHVQLGHDDREDDEEGLDADGLGSGRNVRLYVCGFLFFVLLFTIFCLILWGASKSYAPEIIVKSMVFENFNVQAGNDVTGVPTDMLSLNSTVKIHYRNPGTFFAVHVTSTPLDLHYYQLKIASGQMKKFTQSRKSQKTVVTIVQANQVPLYGGVPLLASGRDHSEKVAVPLNLTFVIRSRAYILGRLVKSKFYDRIRCPLTLTGSKLGKPHNLTNSCVFD